MRPLTILSTLVIFVTLQFCQPANQSKSTKNIAFKMFSRAVEQYQAYNYEDALDYINKAIESNRRIASYYELKGDIHTRQGKLEEANQEYDRAKALRSFYPEVYLKSARNYFQLGDYPKSIRNYKKAIAQRPQQTNILLKLAECTIQQNELVLAENILSDYELQIQKQKQVIEKLYYVLFAKIKFEEGDFDKAVSLIDIAYKTSSLSRNEAVFFSLALIEIKQFEKAYRLATVELKNELHQSDINFIRGLYYFHQNNFKDAKTQLELSIKNKTTLFEAYSTLAKIYLHDGDSEEADKVTLQGKPFANQRLINFDLGY